MVSLTMIGRVSDGLPLASSIEGEEQQDQNTTKFVNQAKLLFGKVKPDSPKKCTLGSGKNEFHYLIDHGACFVCLCEKNFPSKLAFSYLDDISREFNTRHGTDLPTASKPYQFIEFGNYIQDSTKRVVARKASGQLKDAQSELQDTQRLMVKNIEDVISRGEDLATLESKAAGLSAMSKQYKQDASYLRLRSCLFEIILILVLLILFLLFIRAILR